MKGMGNHSLFYFKKPYLYNNHKYFIILKDQYQMVATTMFGLEPLLEKELKSIGAKNTKIGNRCVYFQGNKKLMYKSNIALRTALKILKNLKKFRSNTASDLYKYVGEIKWFEIFNSSNTFSVSSTVNSKHFKHSNYVSLIVKDAIVDQFRMKFKDRPSVDLKNPDFNIHIHISNNECNLYLNSSGQSLHKRGYRNRTFSAPMNEVLAAGIILSSNWNEDKKLINPMCGSGTLLIEAALIAINRAPNIYRASFNFQNWKDYDSKLFNNLKSQIIKNEKKFSGIIEGFDVSAFAITIAKQHVNNMKLNDFIKIQGKDFFNSKGDENSIIIINPPYGKRIELKKDYYKNIGNTLKQNYTNTNAWIISSELEEIKKIGLRPSKKIKLFNGALECRLLKYELYAGTKKTHKFQNV